MIAEMQKCLVWPNAGWNVVSRLSGDDGTSGGCWFGFLEPALIEAAVEFAVRKEVFVFPFAQDAAPVDDENLVGIDDGGESMGNDEGDAVYQQGAGRFLDAGFGEVIHRGSSFVEDQDARISEQGAREGDQLSLANRQLDAALVDIGVVAFRQRFDEVRHVDDASHGAHFFIGGAGVPESDILPNGPREEEGILRNDAHLPSQAV